MDLMFSKYSDLLIYESMDARHSSYFRERVYGLVSNAEYFTAYHSEVVTGICTAAIQVEDRMFRLRYCVRPDPTEQCQVIILELEELSISGYLEFIKEHKKLKEEALIKIKRHGIKDYKP